MRHRVDVVVTVFGVVCGVRIAGLHRGIPTGKVCPPIRFFWSLPPLMVESFNYLGSLRPSVSLGDLLGRASSTEGSVAPLCANGWTSSLADAPWLVPTLRVAVMTDFDEGQL